MAHLGRFLLLLIFCFIAGFGIAILQLSPAVLWSCLPDNLICLLGQNKDQSGSADRFVSQSSVGEPARLEQADSLRQIESLDPTPKAKQGKWTGVAGEPFALHVHKTNRLPQQLPVDNTRAYDIADRQGRQGSPGVPLFLWLDRAKGRASPVFDQLWAKGNGIVARSGSATPSPTDRSAVEVPGVGPGLGVPWQVPGAEALAPAFRQLERLVAPVAQMPALRPFLVAPLGMPDLSGALLPTGTWGFIDESGKVIIKPQYEGCRSFSEGLAAVRFKGRWGYVSRSGKLVIEPRFDEALDFRYGLAPVRSGNRWGFIDAEGRQAVQMLFDDACVFSRSLLLVKTGNLWGLIDRSGRFVVEPIFSIAKPPGEDGAGALVASRGKWGFLDVEGRFLIRPSFRMAGDFHEGLAPVDMSQ